MPTPEGALPLQRKESTSSSGCSGQFPVLSTRKSNSCNGIGLWLYETLSCVTRAELLRYTYAPGRRRTPALSLTRIWHGFRSASENNSGPNSVERRTRNLRFSQWTSCSGMVEFWARARRRLRSSPVCRVVRHLFASGVLDHGLWQTALPSYRNPDSPKLDRQPGSLGIREEYSCPQVLRSGWIPIRAWQAKRNALCRSYRSAGTISKAVNGETTRNGIKYA